MLPFYFTTLSPFCQIIKKPFQPLRRIFRRISPLIFCTLAKLSRMCYDKKSDFMLRPPLNPKEAIIMPKPIKTNVLRHLTALKIPYETREYPVVDDHFDGKTVAALVNLPPEMVYKTLVLCGDHLPHLVCVVPVEKELDLKAVARAAGCKSVSMLPQKELLPLTGYVRGGCSPIGMKKHFPTFLDETAQLYAQIAVSAGQRGVQIIVNPELLQTYVGAALCDLTD